MKKISTILISFCFTCALFADDTPKTTTETAPANAQAAPSGPTTAAHVMSPAEKKLKDEMTQLFEMSKKVNSTNAGEKQKARAAVESTMDWDRIARDCLGPDLWKKNASQSNEFSKLLKEVIQLTAYNRLDKFWGSGVNFTLEDIKITGKTTKVVSHFQSKDQSEMVLEYFLNHKSKWTIYDISYEGEQYSKNIREQIEAFLGEKKSFANLLDKLRKKKKDLLEEAAKPKTKANADSSKKSG